MKSDLDRLMQARGLVALVTPVHEVYNPALDYLVGGVKITHGMAIKQIGQTPLIVAHLMEVEEAAATGYPVQSMTDLGYYDLLKANDNDVTRTDTLFMGHCLERLGVPAGKVGIYGVGRLHSILAQVDGLREAFPAYLFEGESGRSIFDEASITKDADELSRIKSVAERTNAVLQHTWDFIASHRADGEMLVSADGARLTIGDVRRFVLKALLDQDLEDTGMIFAQGRDAGFPHSRGQDSQALQREQSIVFDLFPRERGGGYHHDITRTWCIDTAPSGVQALYDQVMTAFEIAVEAFGVDKPTHLMQEAVQDYFESNGHPTARSQPGTQSGYVHGLGHGIGLEIHERPGISHLNLTDSFQVGNVITIEPGLYYPDDGVGVRVEDSFIVNEAGELVSISSFKKDLVLPLNP